MAQLYVAAQDVDDVKNANRTTRKCHKNVLNGEKFETLMCLYVHRFVLKRGRDWYVYCFMIDILAIILK